MIYESCIFQSKLQNNLLETLRRNYDNASQFHQADLINKDMYIFGKKEYITTKILTETSKMYLHQLLVWMIGAIVNYQSELFKFYKEKKHTKT